LQNLWSCSDPIYHGNTSKWFPIPIL
jgi:hypothetical protein